MGVAYIVFGGYLLMHPLLGVASLTLLLASLFLIEGVLGHCVVRQSTAGAWIKLGVVRRRCDPASLAADLGPLAIEFGMGDWHAGRREHDYERCNAGDDVGRGTAADRNSDAAESSVRRRRHREREALRFRVSKPEANEETSPRLTVFTGRRGFPQVLI